MTPRELLRERLTFDLEERPVPLEVIEEIESQDLFKARLE